MELRGISTTNAENERSQSQCKANKCQARENVRKQSGAKWSQFVKPSIKSRKAITAERGKTSAGMKLTSAFSFTSDWSRIINTSLFSQSSNADVQQALNAAAQCWK